MKAVVLLSGGLDSTTCLAMAKDAGFEVHALTIAYGQRHGMEIQAAQRIAAAMDVPHKLAYVALGAWGGSALTDRAIAVPTEPSEGIPATYVPARNTVLLGMALSYAEAIGASTVFIGVSSVDYSGYPDCRPEYIDAVNYMASVGMKTPVLVRAPLVNMTKADTIRAGLALGVDYDLTHSCYQPTDGQPCHVCDSCRIRDAAFKEVDTHA